MKERMADYLAGSMGAAARAEVEAHLSGCQPCREMAALWEKMEALPEELPSPALRARFEAMLAAHEQREAHRISFAAWLEGWWPQRPAFQLGFAALLLAVGIGAGRLSMTPGASESQEQMARLQEEVHSMRQMVAVSLLQQQSASERLRGVSFSYQVAHPDAEVLAALVRTLESDPSVDVRLAAVDALRKSGQEAVVRQGLIAALEKQVSPLVKIEIIDSLVALKEPSAAGPLQQMEQDPALNEAVRERAKWGLAQLRGGATWSN